MSSLPEQSRSREDPSPPSDDSDSSEDLLDTRDDDGWEDAEPEEENEAQIVSLLDEKSFPDVLSMLEYCKEKYNFDFLSIRDRFSLDFYGMIKLVNFIRSEVKAGRRISSNVSKSDFDSDEFLKPVLQDDALLFSLEDLPVLSAPASETLDKNSGNMESTDLLARIAELEEQLRDSQSKFDHYKRAVEDTLDARWQEGAPLEDPTKAADRVAEQDDVDTHYFSSYSYNDIHETMLKDTVRTDAYRDFIYNHKHLFQGKVVLDVGCGTGILSLFCAKAGASKVIAVDNSAIIDKARENVFNNGFSDTITCLRGKIEEVSLPVEKVDIIVSEWMGYCLLYEAMLDSVIWARDKYLKSDGLMVPSHVNLWLAPFADSEYVAEHFAFWRDVYGFDMKAMQAGIYDDAQVLHMPSDTLCADPVPVRQFDLHSTSKEDLSFKTPWTAVLTKDIDPIDGFIVWFDIFFEESRNNKVPKDARAENYSTKNESSVAFTTGPFSKETHWRQGVMFVNNAVHRIHGAKGYELDGDLEYAVPGDNSRALDVTVSFKGETGSKYVQLWKMR